MPKANCSARAHPCCCLKLNAVHIHSPATTRPLQQHSRHPAQPMAHHPALPLTRHCRHLKHLPGPAEHVSIQPHPAGQNDMYASHKGRWGSRAAPSMHAVAAAVMDGKGWQPAAQVMQHQYTLGWTCRHCCHLCHTQTTPFSPAAGFLLLCRAGALGGRGEGSGQALPRLTADRHPQRLHLQLCAITAACRGAWHGHARGVGRGGANMGGQVASTD